LSAREAFEVFQSEIQSTESLEASTDLSPKPHQQQHELAEFGIAARVVHLSGHTVAGRLLRASSTGLVVHCAEPLPFRSTVLTEWTAFGDYKMAFAAHVIRAAANELAVRFVLESDLDRQFLTSFLELAKTGGKTLEVTVRQVREDDESLDVAGSARRLEQAWNHLEARFKSDEAHQRFIQTCLRLRRIDFALGRYREALKRPATRATAQRYIDQLGKILSFSGFQRGSEAGGGTPSKRWMGLIAVGLLLLGLLAAFQLFSRQLQRPPPPIESLPQ
jgi:hypothetical protein